MTAAIYARTSTDQSDVSDEQKSVARQVEHARAYAVRKGWIVADEHVYVDDGISGAEFASRPGFLRLMNALKPRAPFKVLVMSEESRLGARRSRRRTPSSSSCRLVCGCSSISRTASGRWTPPPTRS
jgi:DNA invertase Pin-like site-specific DNA recombinase